MKDLLRVADLSSGDVTRILDLASELATDPSPWSSRLEGENVVCYFAKPSTRTRLSFGAALTRLGGAAQMVGSTELQLGRGETIEDTARVISRYAKAVVDHTTVPVEVLA